MSKFTVTDLDNGNEREFDNRGAAEDAMDDMQALGANVELTTNAETDGGTAAEVVEDTPEPTEAHVDTTEDTYDLPDSPRVDEDPLTWMPSEFIDQIDGTPAINKKGFSVLCQHYGISVDVEKTVSPNETEFAYAECRAIATTPKGEEYVAYGSAHVDRGDDSFTLLEYADTRAFKRAASRATGVGLLAVEEIRSGSE